MIPSLLRDRRFALFWLGLTVSQIGTRATSTANLWQVQELTDSTLAVGVVSLCEGVALLVLAPLAGTVADRVDRKRLLQTAQSAALVASAGLAVLTFTHAVTPLWIYVAVTIVSGAASFDGPARQSIVPALVPRERLVEAFALVQPAFAFARLAGPALAGVLIAVGGSGAVYVFDVATYVVLVLTLASLAIPRNEVALPAPLWKSVAEGLRYVRNKPVVWQLMSLDLAATFFAAYRVVLPALARDVFAVGAAGYGLLSAAPAAGAILGSGVIYRSRGVRRKGAIALGATMAYAACAAVLALAPAFSIALVSAFGLGLTDAVAVTIRQAAVQLETPDHLRGRVTSLYQMNSRGGPALGQAQLGATAAVIGAPLALTLGALATFAVALWLAVGGTTVRDYEA